MSMNFSTKRPQPQGRRHDFGEIAKILLGRGTEVCRKLLPGGHMAGNEWIAGDLTGTKGRSLSVNVRTGVWKDFAGDAGGGDLISLWAAVEGCEQGEAKAAAERWLGIATGSSVVERTTDNRQGGGSSPSPSTNPDTDWWKKAKPVKTWDYVTADGEVFGTVYRFERTIDGKREKVIRPWDGHRWRAPEGARPLYRLPEVMAHSGPVVVVEGEKAADAIVDAGWCGTTCWGGAQAIGKADWTPLQGRDVILWRDNDDAGLAWLDKIGAALREVGVASARISAPPGDKPAKWDAADATLDERRAILAETLKREPDFVGRKPFRLSDWSVDRYMGPAPEQRWLIRNILPMGGVCMLAAAGGTGKSLLLLDLALKVTQPRLPGIDIGADGLTSLGGYVEERGSVVLLSAEDDTGELHRRTLGIDGQRIRRDKAKKAGHGFHVIPAVDIEDPTPMFYMDGNRPAVAPFFDVFLEQLRAIPNLKLVVIDPLASFVLVDINSDPMMAYFVLTGLNRITRETGATVLVAHHMSKPPQSRPIVSADMARTAIRGTSGLVDRCRVNYAVWPMAEDRALKVFRTLNRDFQRNLLFEGAVVKSNVRTDDSVRTFLRNQQSGLLEDVSQPVRENTPPADDLLEALYHAIGVQAAGGAPFQTTGANSPFKRKDVLPRGLAHLHRRQLEQMVSLLLQENRVVYCNPPGRGRNCLDVKGGALTMDYGAPDMLAAEKGEDE